MLEDGLTTYTVGSEAMRMPGQLPDLRPTDREIAMIRSFPDDSELLHSWVGSAGGHIVIDQPTEGSAHHGDDTFYQGRIVSSDGDTVQHVEYRAEPAGRIAKGTARALGWLAGEAVAPRGWLSGRVYTPDEPGA